MKNTCLLSKKQQLTLAMTDENELTSEEILNLLAAELQEWIRKKRIELGIEPEPLRRTPQNRRQAIAATNGSGNPLKSLKRLTGA